MTLRERMQAMAEEYQRNPRWLRSQDVARLLEGWLSEPEIQPGPCMERYHPVVFAGQAVVTCSLLAGHAGGHTNGVTSWRDTTPRADADACTLVGGHTGPCTNGATFQASPDADVERTDFQPGNRARHTNCGGACPA